MANGTQTNDTVIVVVTFGANGVTLNTTTFPGQSNPTQPTPAQVLAELSGKSRLAMKESLERALREIHELPADREVVSAERLRLSAVGNLSPIAFVAELPSNQVKVSRSHATQFIFYAPGDWTFHKRGFFPDDDPLDPTAGIFTDLQISNGGGLLWVTFVPNPQGPARRIKYNLEMITKVTTNSVFDGFAIIIIDPIIEKSLQ
jgi:hypothetical protein